jgi:hypothetical protein
MEIDERLGSFENALRERVSRLLCDGSIGFPRKNSSKVLTVARRASAIGGKGTRVGDGDRTHDTGHWPVAESGHHSPHAEDTFIFVAMDPTQERHARSRLSAGDLNEIRRVALYTHQMLAFDAILHRLPRCSGNALPRRQR